MVNSLSQICSPCRNIIDALTTFPSSIPQPKIPIQLREIYDCASHWIFEWWLSLGNIGEGKWASLTFGIYKLMAEVMTWLETWLKSINDWYYCWQCVSRLVLGGIIDLKFTPHASLVKFICPLKIPIKILKLGASTLETGSLAMNLCTYLWVVPSVVHWNINDWTEWFRG